MGTRRARDLPVHLNRVRQRFERWRGTRKVPSRIPKPLWASAVKLAGTYGTSRTARVLRLDYYTLKKRVEGAPAVAASKMPTRAAFLEVPPPVWSNSGECTLELEDAGGAKLRVHLKGFGAPDLAELSRSFWQSES